MVAAIARLCAFWLAGLLCLPAWAQEPPVRESRSALVIGNAAYGNARLRTPVEDAGAVAQRLSKLGFKVRLVEDADQREMVNAFRDYLGRAQDSAVRLIFFAGHGVQWRGRNYLLPTDLVIQNEDDLPNRAMDITEVVERLAQLRGGINIVILDACRDSPFVAGVARLADARRARMRGLAAPPNSSREGLAPLAVPSGTVVAFSTSPGALASDGDGQRHSVYARHFLDQLDRPGQTIERMLKQVRIGVAHETKLAQVPWESSSLMGEFCFRPDARGACGGN